MMVRNTRREERGALQELLLLHLINDPGVKQLLHKQRLLAQHSHGGSVGLDGLESLWRLHLPLQNEAPHLHNMFALRASLSMFSILG